MFTNEIRSYKSHADHRKQTCDTPSFSQVVVFDVEARRFHGTECRFNLPAFFIGRYSIFRSVATFSWETLYVSDIIAFCNAGKVYLFVNGENMGEAFPDNYVIVRWQSIPLQLGENHIRVQSFSNGDLSDEMTIFVTE